MITQKSAIDPICFLVIRADCDVDHPIVYVAVAVSAPSMRLEFLRSRIRHTAAPCLPSSSIVLAYAVAATRRFIALLSRLLVAKDACFVEIQSFETWVKCFEFRILRALWRDGSAFGDYIILQLCS